MNLREKLRALLGELEKAESAEEIKRLSGEIKSVKAQIDLADEKKSILESMKAPAPVEAGTAKAAPRTLGEKAAAVVKEKGVGRTDRFSLSTEGSGEKAAGDPAMTPTGGYAVTATDVRPEIQEGARRELTVADLFSQESTEMNAVTYFEEGPVEGTITTVAENGKFPELSFGEPKEKTAAVKKVGCTYKETDELIDDLPRLASSIDNRAHYLMDVAVEDQVIAGDGEGTNLDGLLNRSGLQLAEFETLTGLIDQVKAAKTAIKKNTPRFRADYVLINDTLWDQVTSLKDELGRYIVGDPFKSSGEDDKLWNLQVVPTQAVDEDTVVVGAFKASGSVVRHGGRDVVIDREGEDLSRGRITIRPSERLALLVYYPAGFVKIGRKAA